MGRPAINTVFNPSADKNLFNATRAGPAADRERRQVPQQRHQHPEVLLEPRLAKARTRQAQAEALAGVLIPDVLPYSRTSTLPAPLNGRALADDVIDVELNITTGGDPLDLFPNRNATGAVPGDGVGPHTDYQSVFPYLGAPH